MDEDFSLAVYIKRGLALLAGLIVGVVLIYLLVGLTAPSRRQEAPAIDAKSMAATALEATIGSAAVPKANTGEEHFFQRCVGCHGADGRGNGPWARLLTSAPRDLMHGPYWLRTTAAGGADKADGKGKGDREGRRADSSRSTAPSRQDVKLVIDNGIPGTAMPGFEKALTDKKAGISGVDLIADYLFAKARYLRKPGTPIEIVEQATGEGWEIEAGKAVYDALKCADCHGPAGYGDGPNAGALKDGRGMPVRVPDLTEPWDFRRGFEPKHIWLTLELGLDGKYMPSLLDKCSSGDRLALAVYVAKGLPRTKFSSKEMQQARERKGAAHQGANLVSIMGCGRCHTPFDDQGLPLAGLTMAGGVEVHTPRGVHLSANLTPDKQDGLGDRKEELVVRALREGVAADGHPIDLSAMPWTWFSKLTTADANAIVTHLGSLKPVSLKIDKPDDGGERPSRFSLLFGSGDLAVWLKTAKGVSAVQPEGDTAAGDDAVAERGEPGDRGEPAKPGAAEETGSGDQTAADDKSAGKGTEPEEKRPDKLGSTEGAGGQDVDDEDSALLNTPEGRLAMAKVRYDEARQRLNEAAASFARAEAEYKKAKEELVGDKKKGKRSRSGDRGDRRSKKRSGSKKSDGEPKKEPAKKSSYYDEDDE
ncbi:MAG: c-type cytochrome [Deltaproteobacteria bacterium]|nr:c-type cytochrome [Deltaproteobacteria bacterium]